MAKERTEDEDLERGRKEIREEVKNKSVEDLVREDPGKRD